ncbi:hypothetical protein WA158_003467 [Blastocystis sp. Blastoise]
MIFKELLISTPFIPDYFENDDAMKAIHKFEEHINRYAGFNHEYANYLMQILCSSFYYDSNKGFSYLFYGPDGANGKTLTGDLLSSIIGDNQAITVNPGNFESKETQPKLIEMSNKLMYYVNELDEVSSSKFSNPVNVFNTRIFKELAEKKSGASARNLYSKSYDSINYTGTLFITSNIQPGSRNTQPLLRRVCFLYGVSRYYDKADRNLYEIEYKNDENNSLKRIMIIPEDSNMPKRYKPNHYPMDPSIKDYFENYKSYIFSYLVDNYFYLSTKLTIGKLDSCKIMAECKSQFIEKSNSLYDMDEFVEKQISVDPYMLNVVSLDDLFNAYLSHTFDRKFTLKKDKETFRKSFFGCLQNKPQYICIDMHNLDLTHKSEYYVGNQLRGILGLLINKRYNEKVLFSHYCEMNKGRIGHPPNEDGYFNGFQNKI